MEASSITSVVTGILTFLGGTGFAKIIDYLKTKSNKKYLDKLTTNLQDLSKIYRVIEHVLNESGAYRVLVLKASNGGGTPKPGSEMFIKLLYAATIEEDLNIYEKYNSIKVDGAYVDMLIDIQKNGQITRVTEDMVNCLLKRIYQSEQVAYTEMFFLGNNAAVMIHL